MMKIPDIYTAETVVQMSPTLSWDGWDVVQKVQDDYAEYLPNGVFDRETGKWYRKRVFSLDCNDGTWSIPDEVIGS